MRLCVIGTGYVGLVAGAGFADFGNDVICADVDRAKIERLRRGEIPIFEPGLEDLVARNVKKGRLEFTDDVAKAVAGAEIVIIAVGTPQGEDGSADLSHVLRAAEQIAKAMTGYALIVTKSTVPVGTADRIREVLRKHARHEFSVASNPEFLKEGDSVNDFMKPNRVVVGTDDERGKDLLRALYAPIVRTNDRLLIMDARSAELTKYAANAMLATRISFMNELANLAEQVGADIERVRRALGADPRIGPNFLFPGTGFGGSCFPKDLQALLRTAHDAGEPLGIVAAADAANARQKTVLVEKMKRQFGDLAGKRFCLWGLAFKPGTDDIREAPALVIIDRLLEAGADVAAHDPAAMDNVRARYGERVKLHADMYAAAEKCDALVLVTEWHDFRRPNFARLKSLLRTPVLFDGRNIWDPAELRGLGFAYYGIGRAL
jgi:UDPglucose 6-dehydrogenase